MAYRRLEMNDTYCTCIVRSLRDDRGSDILPTVLEFFVSLVISVAGFLLNYKFLKKLKLEKKINRWEEKGILLSRSCAGS